MTARPDEIAAMAAERDALSLDLEKVQTELDQAELRIKDLENRLAAASPGEKVAVADQIIGQIEERFPNWRSYRDLIDCIDCTLHDLRNVDPRFTATPTPTVDASAIREAFVAGATAVHNEWNAAVDRGERMPPRDPDFSEAASDYAALSAPAEKAGDVAVELAYGLLWLVGCDRSTSNGNALYLAHKALYEKLDKAGQARGITSARQAVNDNPYMGGSDGARARSHLGRWRRCM